MLGYHKLTLIVGAFECSLSAGGPNVDQKDVCDIFEAKNSSPKSLGFGEKTLFSGWLQLLDYSVGSF